MANFFQSGNFPMSSAMARAHYSYPTINVFNTISGVDVARRKVYTVIEKVGFLLKDPI